MENHIVREVAECLADVALLREVDVLNALQYK
jgi:hypothetical protein